MDKDLVLVSESTKQRIEAYSIEISVLLLSIKTLLSEDLIETVLLEELRESK